MTTTDDALERESRRRVLVGIATATGLLALLAAASAHASLGLGGVTLFLVLSAGAAFGVAALLALGRGEWLTEDDQLLWLGEREGRQER